MIKHVIVEGKTLMGKGDAKQALPSAESSSTGYDNKIPLSGVSVQEKHALLVRKKTEVTIEPASPSSQVCYIFQWVLFLFFA